MRKVVITFVITAMFLATGAEIAAAKTGRFAIKSKSATASNRVTAGKATVKVSSFQFEPKVLTISAGTTVQWVNEGGRHTVEADNGSFKSDTLTDGKTFEHTFDKPGTYPYHCSFHGESGGKDMAGKIVVTRAKK